MADLRKLLGGTFSVYEPAQQQIEDPSKQLKSQIFYSMGHAPENVVLDGKMHRFSTNSKKRDDAGWYVAFDGDVPAGCFGNWRSGDEFKWVANVGRELSAEEKMRHQQRMAEAKAQKEKEITEKNQSAATRAQYIIENTTTASKDHPYLISHGIGAHNLTVSGDGRLIAPMFSVETGDIVGVQYIATDGEKRFLEGSKAGGAAWVAGRIEPEKGLFIAEGVAKAIAIYEQTGIAAVAAFSAGNIPSVAVAMRDRYGIDCKITVLADNDESGTGQKYGVEAAEKTGAKLIVMPNMGEDINDFLISGGNVKELLLGKQEKESWLVDADDFSSQPQPVKWIIKKHLQSEALMMLHGPSGGGKTFVVLDMCLHVASGKQWNGIKTTRGGVVYLAGEGHQGLRSRIAAWRKKHCVDKIGKMWVSKSGTDLNKPAGLLQAIESIKELPEAPALIVVDTLHRFLDGDENSAQDAKSMIDACGALQKRFGCSVLLVHHTGTAEDSQHRARGSSAWRGALDIEFSVLPDKENKGCLQLVQMKNKDAEMVEKVSIKIDGVELDWVDEDGEKVTSAVAKIITSREIAEQKEEEATQKKPLAENSERLLSVIKWAWLKDGGGEKSDDGFPKISKKAVVNWFGEAVESGKIPWVDVSSKSQSDKREVARRERGNIGIGAKREWERYGLPCIDSGLLRPEINPETNEEIFVLTDPISPIFWQKITGKIV